MKYGNWYRIKRLTEGDLEEFIKFVKIFRQKANDYTEERKNNYQKILNNWQKKLENKWVKIPNIF